MATLETVIISFCYDGRFLLQTQLIYERTLGLTTDGKSLCRVLLPCGNGNLSRFPGTRESTSLDFTTDVKEETQLGPTEVYSASSILAT